MLLRLKRFCSLYSPVLINFPETFSVLTVSKLTRDQTRQKKKKHAGLKTWDFSPVEHRLATVRGIPPRHKTYFPPKKKSREILSLYASLDFTALHYSQNHTSWRLEQIRSVCLHIMTWLKLLNRFLFCVVAGGAEQLADLEHGSTQVGGDGRKPRLFDLWSRRTALSQMLTYEGSSLIPENVGSWNRLDSCVKFATDNVLTLGLNASVKTLTSRAEIWTRVGRDLSWTRTYLRYFRERKRA